MFNMMDNVATKAVKTYLESEHIKMKLVEPHNYLINAADMDTQNFKNHTIVVMCICNEESPSIL